MLPDKIEMALTFDDLLLKPSASKVLPSEVSLATRLTSTIQLNTPLISAAMDTVTGSASCTRIWASTGRCSRWNG
jgi:IMP dehydrogenase